MKRVLLIVLAVLSGVAIVSAQAQPPYTTANKLAWTASANASTAAAAQALNHLLTIDSGSSVVLSGVVCTGTTPAITCTSPLTASMVSTLNAIGRHTLTLAAASGTLVSPISDPFIADVAPAKPTGLSIN